LVVKSSTGEWIAAREAARELGPFTVLTSDNPFSNALEPTVNALRRTELRDDLLRRGVQLRPTIGRDPLGAWPAEEGFALFEQSVDFARTLARAWDQFAIYDVTEEHVLVRSVDTGEILS
jgi:hypothetical protein